MQDDAHPHLQLSPAQTRKTGVVVGQEPAQRGNDPGEQRFRNLINRTADDIRQEALTELESAQRRI